MASLSFRTEIRLKPSGWKIRYPDIFFSLGSCFAEHWHHKLKETGFGSFSNPCGIVYNPISLAHQLSKTLSASSWEETDLVFHDNLYHGLLHHGSFSHQDPRQTLDAMNERLMLAHAHLFKSTVLVITLGTALVYIHKPTGRLVANCHKIPANQFERRFLSVEEILNAYAPLLEQVKAILPALRIILTVSPVRYLKEGFVDNSISKSILLLAARQLLEANDQIHYFPAYEILLDDLRDYRFYEEDMTHPNEQAIDYIWSRFTSCYFEPDTIYIMDQVKKLNLSQKHRALHPESSGHREFLLALDQKISALKKQYPFIVWK